MPAIKTMIGRLALLTSLALVAVNPAAAADRKTTNTIIGAGIGAAAGAVLTQGDTLATLGGAAAGGLLGNILTEEPRKRHRGYAGSRSHHHHHYVDHRHKPRHIHHASSKKGKWKGHPKHRHHGSRHHRR